MIVTDWAKNYLFRQNEFEVQMLKLLASYFQANVTHVSGDFGDLFYPDEGTVEQWILDGKIHMAANYQIMIGGTEFHFVYSYGVSNFRIYGRQPIQLPAFLNITSVFAVSNPSAGNLPQKKKN